MVMYSIISSFKFSSHHTYTTIPPIRSYRFGFNGQEKDNELKGESNSYAFEYRIHDPRLGRFLSVDPLFKQYPELSSYQFAGNQVIVAKDMEGKEPEWMIDKTGRLTTPMVTLLNAAFGFNKKTMQSTHFVMNEAKVGDHYGYTWFSTVYYSELIPQASWDVILGLISHELVHRHQVDNNKVGPWEPSRDLFDFVRPYYDRFKEHQGYQFGLSDHEDIPIPAEGQYADQLAKYKDGIIFTLLTNAVMSHEARTSQIEKVGNQFYRDVILKDYITQSRIEIEHLQYKMDHSIDLVEMDQLQSSIDSLNEGIKDAQKQQQEITKKYGE